MYTWVVSYEGLDPSFNNVYYLQLQNGDNTATSHYFNISAAETTSDPPATTTSSMTTSTANPSLISQATATATPTVIRDTGGGLSADETAGIAVGAVAIMLILVGGYGDLGCWLR